MAIRLIRLGPCRRSRRGGGGDGWGRDRAFRYVRHRWWRARDSHDDVVVKRLCVDDVELRCVLRGEVSSVRQEMGGDVTSVHTSRSREPVPGLNLSTRAAFRWGSGLHEPGNGSTALALAIQLPSPRPGSTGVMAVWKCGGQCRTTSLGGR